ncbi:MAG: glycosyltransferase family 39 protein, partial [Acidimicrobiales bacterium]
MAGNAVHPNRAPSIPSPSPSPALSPPPPRQLTAAAQARERTAPIWAAVASWCLVAVGVGLRIRQFAFRRSLWTDEASLAFNILHRGYGGLTRPLDVVQGAPIGFLWMEKTATELFGTSEYALRLVPLIAGLVSVVMFRDLANKVLTPLAADVGLAL